MKAFPICACVTALVVCAGACSSGGRNQSTPTTASGATTTLTRVPSVPRAAPGRVHVAAKLGPCPKRPPLFTDRANGDTKGLDKELVPIVAVNVRICEYLSYGDISRGKLVASGLLAPRLAATFAKETNLQPRGYPGPVSVTGPGGANDYFDAPSRTTPSTSTYGAAASGAPIRQCSTDVWSAQSDDAALGSRCRYPRTS